MRECALMPPISHAIRIQLQALVGHGQAGYWSATKVMLVFGMFCVAFDAFGGFSCSSWAATLVRVLCLHQYHAYGCGALQHGHVCLITLPVLSIKGTSGCVRCSAHSIAPKPRTYTFRPCVNQRSCHLPGTPHLSVCPCLTKAVAWVRLWVGSSCSPPSKCTTLHKACSTHGI